ncbi:MAG: hypothetical protein AB1796_01860 [Bacillota bacterium]
MKRPGFIILLVYLQKTARFDLGMSIQYGRPVYPLVMDKLRERDTYSKAKRNRIPHR